ncbi:hypothetical protein [Labrys monachus]|uniref:Uncharacterized protein n=1 Tax=Labrys monachus TaxID=217067 RepID=A0ABU0F734_9HYPH|nr:hypothetical protein [Labrys monachus]MDQ0390427.1 hypothetical protein [Labrys monachus]
MKQPVHCARMWIDGTVEVDLLLDGAALDYQEETAGILGDHIEGTAAAHGGEIELTAGERLKVGAGFDQPVLGFTRLEPAPGIAATDIQEGLVVLGFDGLALQPPERRD